MKRYQDHDAAYFRELLIHRREALLQADSGGQEAAQTVVLDQARVGRLSRMDALQTQAISQETNRRREVELRRIATALQRMADEDYGYCVECGEDIAFRRLEVDPAAPLCIDCANQAE